MEMWLKLLLYFAVDPGQRFELSVRFNEPNPAETGWETGPAWQHGHCTAHCRRNLWSGVSKTETWFEYKLNLSSVTHIIYDNICSYFYFQYTINHQLHLLSYFPLKDEGSYLNSAFICRIVMETDARLVTERVLLKSDDYALAEQSVGQLGYQVGI